jgi:hypothetical protein
MDKSLKLHPFLHIFASSDLHQAAAASLIYLISHGSNEMQLSMIHPMTRIPNA